MRNLVTSPHGSLHPGLLPGGDAIEIGRGTENRTPVDWLKASYSTTELYPHWLGMFFRMIPARSIPPRGDTNIQSAFVYKCMIMLVSVDLRELATSKPPSHVSRNWRH
jgi:hypothetical protein